MRTLRLVAMICALALMLVSIPAAAGDDRISRGDVQKTFQTFPVSDEGRIGFLQDGDVFCPEDWHVLAVGLLIDQSKEGREALRDAEVTILLDGVDAPATKESGIRAFLPRGSNDKQIFKHWGKFIAPGSLDERLHTYEFKILYPPPNGVLPLGEFDFTLDATAC